MWGWVEKVKGISKKTPQSPQKTHGHRQYGNYQRKGVRGEAPEDKRGMSGDGRRLGLRW